MEISINALESHLPMANCTFIRYSAIVNFHIKPNIGRIMPIKRRPNHIQKLYNALKCALMRSTQRTSTQQEPKSSCEWAKTRREGYGTVDLVMVKPCEGRFGAPA
jgi:hypothetical protein